MPVGKGKQSLLGLQHLPSRNFLFPQDELTPGGSGLFRVGHCCLLKITIAQKLRDT